MEVRVMIEDLKKRVDKIAKDIGSGYSELDTHVKAFNALVDALALIKALSEREEKLVRALKTIKTAKKWDDIFFVANGTLKELNIE
jgi:hypothetical protein